MDYDIFEAFEAIENELIESMMRNFRRHRAEEDELGYNWSQWQAEQLKSLEQYRKTNATKFSKQFSSINAKVAEMLEMAREDGNAEQEIAILEAIQNGFKVPDVVPDTPTGEFFKVNNRKLDALIKATTSDLEKAETAILRRANDEYRTAIFNAQVYANTGAGTYEKAVDMACRDMLRAGLSCVEYKNGSRHRLSEYAKMAIRTANKRAYLYGEGEKRQEWGISTVVVNSRQGGCHLCKDYIGKVFIDDVYSGGKKSDGNYPLLSKAIEAGLFHPNCKDSTSTYFEGITTLEPLSSDEREELDRRRKLEAQKNYYDNQAEKCDRISEHSLDKDNKRTYKKRAQTCKQKADEIGGKIAESLEKSDGSGIIELNRKVNRRETNIGAFANLKVPMQKRYVIGCCEKYGISTKGLTFKITRSESLLKLNYFGLTDYDNIGRIDLLPNAFIDEEQLVKTILHEKCHVKQLKKYGKKYVQKHLDDMERKAYRFERVYYTILKRRLT